MYSQIHAYHFECSYHDMSLMISLIWNTHYCGKFLYVTLFIQQNNTVKNMKSFICNYNNYSQLCTSLYYEVFKYIEQQSARSDQSLHVTSGDFAKLVYMSGSGSYSHVIKSSLGTETSSSSSL